MSVTSKNSLSPHRAAENWFIAGALVFWETRIGTKVSVPVVFLLMYDTWLVVELLDGGDFSFRNSSAFCTLEKLHDSQTLRMYINKELMFSTLEKLHDSQTAQVI